MLRFYFSPFSTTINSKFWLLVWVTGLNWYNKVILQSPNKWFLEGRAILHLLEESKILTNQPEWKRLNIQPNIHQAQNNCALTQSRFVPACRDPSVVAFPWGSPAWHGLGQLSSSASRFCKWCWRSLAVSSDNELAGVMPTKQPLFAKSNHYTMHLTFLNERSSFKRVVHSETHAAFIIAEY